MRAPICWIIALGLVSLQLASLAIAEEKATAKKKKLSKAVQLFDGKTLDGWEFFVEDPKVKMGDVWSVKDGVIVCTGEPMGYISTKEKYKDFRLSLQWRWAPGKEPGNSGVFLRISGKPMALPRCIEAQLKSGGAGDAYGFRGFKLKGDKERFFSKVHPTLGPMCGVRRILLEEGKSWEKEPGQWNTYDIVIKGGKLNLKINGQKVNAATDCEPIEGAVGLQSEGGEIHFRNIELVPLR